MNAPSFASWAAAMSQRSNRSLAGSRVRLAQQGVRGTTAHDTDAMQAQLWGMVPSAAPCPADFDLDDCLDAMDDVTAFSGQEAIDHASRHMPVLHAVMRHVRRESDLHGVRIAVCLVLEPKTAVLLRELADAGATLGVFCEPSATDGRVSDQLRREGVAVYSNPSWSSRQARRAALRLLDDIRPDILIDDGGNLARLAALERPDIAARLIGVAEETTSGVRALRSMQDAHALPYPVIAVNDSALKTHFDNAHGTGETCVTTMQRVLGAHAFDHAKVTVIGYGPVGKGFAMRVRALGAQVTVCDTDPVAALRAVFDGFAASDPSDCLPRSDMAISATGVRHTLSVEQMSTMRDGAVLAVIGGVANELALDDLPDFSPDGSERRSIVIPNGPTLTLLADGDGVTYGSQRGPLPGGLRPG